MRVPKTLSRILPAAAVALGLFLAPASADAASKKPVTATIALGDKRKATKPTKLRAKHKTAKHKTAKHKARKHKAKKKHKKKSAHSAATAVQCANTTLTPAADNLDLVAAAIVCLHNQVRVAAGLPALKDNAKLQKAALRHSRDMVSEGYFDHTAPDGETFVDRVIGAGYARSTDAWTLGENLAWGTGDLGTPAGMMQSWMNSAGHKANILKRDYREVGIGIRLGVPSDDSVGVTVTADFGVKL